MTITLGSGKRTSKSPPMTDEEMGQMWRDGDPMSLIASRAQHRNGLRKSEVREIVHRVCGMVEMGEGR